MKGKKDSQQFQISGYTITGLSDATNKLFGITPEIQSALQSLQKKVQGRQKNVVPELLRYIDKYPRIPQFHNLLSVEYSMQGHLEKARELNNYILSEHPDYLIAKLNLANEYISKKQYDKVPGILGEAMELKALYPSRNEFHISEVTSFLQTAIEYFTGIADIQAIEIRVDILKKINNEFRIIPAEEIHRIEHNLSIIQMKVALEQLEEEKAKSRQVEAIPVEVVEPTSEKPIFTHAIMEQLYCNSLRINPELLKDILSLPRESLIADLHKIIYDSIARFRYIEEETEWSPVTHEYLTHAVSLLTELTSEESLEPLLDLLRQDDDFIEFWFSDSLFDILWELLFISGKNKLIELRKFLFEPNHSSYNRAIISETVVQMVLHEPERRVEIIQWYKEILDEILRRKKDETIIDTEWIAFLVSDLIEIKAKELSEAVKDLFYHDMVSDYITGSFASVLDDFNSDQDFSSAKTDFFKNIFEKYQDFVETWYYYNGTDDTDDEDFDDDFDDELNEDFKIPDLFNQTSEDRPIFNPNRNIGRNDPCPCGSGKKYKKCCMNKDV